ncbi:MAG TPA: hypothetical protein VEM96_01550 [Pyrinomonadaceae bacterium]|nr:hypothetical protein [Pyrinomonadaceae bacterium]
MKTSATTIAFAIAFAFLAISGRWGGPRSAVIEPRSVPASPNAISLLEEDFAKLCGCVQAFGPPAPVLDPNVLPVDVSLQNNTACVGVSECPNPNGCCQPCFDCFGWQLFVALNWPAKSAGEPDPGKPFGEPREYSDVVWQTYKSAFDVFGDKQPTPWGASGAHELQLNSAVIKDTFLKYDLQSDHNWLTDEAGNVVRYEIRVNKDEFQYILRNDLWHQEGIWKAVTTGPGIELPSQKSDFGDVGAMEVKAAWRIIPEARRAYFEENYKVAHAKVYDPTTKGWKDQDVALVGLHIIKKTPKSPQWVWATFEHKDNAPVQGDSGEGRQWNFFNPELFKKDPNYKPNSAAPPYRIATNKPVQVFRVKQASSDDLQAHEINDAMHKLIAARFPHSVWRNYDLISVQWPREPAKPDPKMQKVLPSGQPRPRVLANTAMETYQQLKNSGGAGGLSPGLANDQGQEKQFPADDLGKSSCIACHRISAVTPTFVNHPEKKGWWTDYSTLFFKAGVKRATPKR